MKWLSTGHHLSDSAPRGHVDPNSGLPGAPVIRERFTDDSIGESKRKKHFMSNLITDHEFEEDPEESDESEESVFYSAFEDDITDNDAIFAEDVI